MLTLPEYRTALTTLSAHALSDTRSLLNALDGLPPVEVRDALIQALPEVLSPYMTASGELAATWFEDLRRDAGLPSVYAQTAGVDLSESRVEALVRWSVKPLFDPDEVVTVESLLSGGSQRIVLGAARETILSAVENESARVLVGFARVARPGCCAFCAMLASRGAVYSSAASAGGVVGVGQAHTEGKTYGIDPRTGKMRTGGIKARGPRALGMDKYHDHCHCTAVPVYEGTVMQEVVDAETDKYLEMYQQAASRLDREQVTFGDRTYTLSESRSQRNMLAAMRQEHGIA